MFRTIRPLVNDELLEVQRVGGLVRIELHTDSLTMILDLTTEDAAAIATDLATAAGLPDQGGPYIPRAHDKPIVPHDFIPYGPGSTCSSCDEQREHPAHAAPKET